MKKMNKIYEAPVAEMIEMQMPVVLMESNLGGGNNATSGGAGASGTTVDPNNPAGTSGSGIGGF